MYTDKDSNLSDPFQEMGNHYQENGRLQESQEVHAQVH